MPRRIMRRPLRKKSSPKRKAIRKPRTQVRGYSSSLVNPRINNRMKMPFPKLFETEFTSDMQQVVQAGSALTYNLYELAGNYLSVGSTTNGPWSGAGWAKTATPGQVVDPQTLGPTGFANLCGLAGPYYDYRVLWSSIKVIIDPEVVGPTGSASSLDTMLLVAPANASQDSSPANITEFMAATSQPRNKYIVIPGSTTAVGSVNATGQSMPIKDRTLSHFSYTHDVFGVPKRNVEIENDYRGKGQSTGPINQWNWNIAIASTDPQSTQTAVLTYSLKVQVKWKVRLETPAYSQLLQTE